MNNIRQPSAVGAAITTFVLILFCVVINESVSEPTPGEQSSSFAMNSGGRGEVTVSCNGKTYKGEGTVACTSAAYRFGSQESSFHCLILGYFLFACRRWFVI